MAGAVGDAATKAHAERLANMAHNGETLSDSESIEGGPAKAPPTKPAKRTGTKPKAKATTKSTRKSRAKAKKDRKTPSSYDDDEEEVLSTDDTFTGPIPCRWPTCTETFDSLEEADIHVKFLHGDKARKIPAGQASPLLRPAAAPKLPTSPPPITIATCTTCGKGCGSPELLAAHIDRNHRPPQTAATLTPCPLPNCGFPCQSMSELAAHVLASHSITGQRPSAFTPVESLPSRPVTSMSGSFGGVPGRRAPSQALPPSSSFALPPLLPGASYTPVPGHYGSISQSHDPHPYVYGGRRELKSGQERSSAPRARLNIAWPHEAFDSVLGQRTYTYDTLNAPALAAGCLAMLFPSPEFLQTPEPIQVYLEHLSVLFHSLAFSGNLKAVLDYHASVLRLVEAGNLTWSRAQAGLLDGLRVNFLALLRSSPGRASQGAAGQNTTAPLKVDKHAEGKKKASRIACGLFNAAEKSSCPQKADHDAVRHICWSCVAFRGIEAAHASSACPHKRA